MSDVKPVFGLCAAACLLLATTPAFANDALPDDIAACAAIADGQARLACFDALAARHASEPVAPVAEAGSGPETSAVAPEPAAEPGPTPITDDIGRERIDGGRSEERPEYSANVVRCEENRQSGQTYFFFENGQVWRQANYRRLRFRECRFEVNLSEDNFGYSMYVPSEDRRVRVTRLR